MFIGSRVNTDDKTEFMKKSRCCLCTIHQNTSSQNINNALKRSSENDFEPKFRLFHEQKYVIGIKLNQDITANIAAS